MADDTAFDSRGAPALNALMSTTTGLSIALVAMLLGAAVIYGRQSQRLDSIEIEVKESRVDVKELRNDVAQLRSIILARTSSHPTSERDP